jgi:hypothetical protein
MTIDIDEQGIRPCSVMLTPTEEFWKQQPEYPLYAFFLHTGKDQDVAEYLSQNSADLDALTGNKCLIFSFEKPSKWDEDWKAVLRKRLGPDFDKQFAEWERLTNYSRNEKIGILTDRLCVPVS